MCLSRQLLSCHSRGFRVPLPGTALLVSVCLCAGSALGGVFPSIGGIWAGQGRGPDARNDLVAGDQ